MSFPVSTAHLKFELFEKLSRPSSLSQSPEDIKIAALFKQVMQGLKVEVSEDLKPSFIDKVIPAVQTMIKDRMGKIKSMNFDFFQYKRDADFTVQKKLRNEIEYLESLVINPFLALS